MKIKIVLVAFYFILSCEQLAAHHRDSSKHFYTNTLEVGGTAATLFNKGGFRIASPASNIFISYTRFFNKQHKWLVKADYHNYNRDNYHYRYTNNRVEGDIAYTMYYMARLSFGKLFEYKQWHFAPYASFGHRWGPGDLVLTNNYPWEYSFERNAYKSNGVGIGNSINYMIKKRWTVGIEGHADYFFENNQLDKFKNTGYKPNQFSLTCHLKAGVLF